MSNGPTQSDVFGEKVVAGIPIPSKAYSQFEGAAGRGNPMKILTCKVAAAVVLLVLFSATVFMYTQDPPTMSQILQEDERTGIVHNITPTIEFEMARINAGLPVRRGTNG